MKHTVMDDSVGDHSQDRSILQPSFERSAILSHMEGNSQSFQCPLTGRSMSSECLVLNKALQWKIKYWIKKNYGNFENASAAIAANSRPTPSKRNLAPCHRKSITTTAPSHFYCPLSRQIMYDQVHVPYSSVSYELQEILKWLDVSDDETCPVSGNPLQRKSLVRNITLADEIFDWCQQCQQNTGFLFTDKANPTSQHCGFIPSNALLDLVERFFFPPFLHVWTPNLAHNPWKSNDEALC
jgi:hypothetical protein